MKSWPELSQEVHHLSGAAWFQSQEDNLRRLNGSLKSMRIDRQLVHQSILYRENTIPYNGLLLMVKIPLHRLVNGQLSRSIYRTYMEYTHL